MTKRTLEAYLRIVEEGFVCTFVLILVDICPNCVSIPFELQYVLPLLQRITPSHPRRGRSFFERKMPYDGSPKGPTPPPTRATGGSDAQAWFIGMMTRKLANKPEK